MGSIVVNNLNNYILRTQGFKRDGWWEIQCCKFIAKYRVDFFFGRNSSSGTNSSKGMASFASTKSLASTNSFASTKSLVGSNSFASKNS